MVVSVDELKDRVGSANVTWLEVLKVYALAGTIHTTVKVLVNYLKTRRMRKMLQDVPFGKYENIDGFAGFFPELNKNRRHDKDWFNKATTGLPVSKFVGLKIEPDSVWVVMRDPANIRHFLKDSFDIYTKAGGSRNPVNYYLQEWLGYGIFTMKHGVGAEDGGSAWLLQRKIASNIFSKANFQTNMGEVFTEKGLKLRQILDVAAQKQEPIDIQKLFFGFTMDSITKIFFGEDADTMGDGVCLYGDAYDAAHRAMVSYAVPATSSLLMLKYLPWPFGGVGGLAWKIHAWSNPLYWDFRRAIRTLDSESRRILRSSRKDPNLSERKDLLALFIRAEDKEKFTEQYLRDMILNFVIAGRDTTACTLSWMFYVLSENPEVQKALAEEIDEKIPDGKVPTLKMLQASNMPYLNGVVYEVLRLFPPVPSDRKTAEADDVFPDGTRVPKGTVVQWHPYALGRDPVVYPEPEVVRPERWIPFKVPAPHEFPVFQAGPRICLGMDMAIFEAKIAAVMLLQKFSFTLKPGEAEKIHYSNTLTMSICNSKEQDSHALWVQPRVRLQN